MEEVGISLKQATIRHVHFIKNVLKTGIRGLCYLARYHRFRQEERVSVAFVKGNYASLSYWSSMTVSIKGTQQTLDIGIFRNPLNSEIVKLQARTF